MSTDWFLFLPTLKVLAIPIVPIASNVSASCNTLKYFNTERSFILLVKIAISDLCDSEKAK